MLVVTSTMGVINGVHGDTTDTRPGVTLGLVLEVGVTGLEEGLLDTTTTSDETNHSAAGGLDGALLAGGHLDLGVAVGVTNDGAVLAGGTGEGSAVTDLLLDVADGGTLRHLTNGENVTDGEVGLLTDVDELAGVHALSSDEKLLVLAVLVGVAEDNLGKGGATAGVVDDVLDKTTDVAVTLSVVSGTQASGAHTVGGVGAEDATMTLSLSTNNASHGLLY